MSNQIVKGHSYRWMINPADAVMLLIDHQSGLFQLVRDIDQPELRAHACALAKVAYLGKTRLLPPRRCQTDPTAH